MIEPFSSENRLNPKEIAIEPTNVTMMQMSANEEIIYYIDKNNQFLKVNLSIEGTQKQQRISEYLIAPFHHEAITGMDTCLRK